jgi:hypothetical protein
MSLDAVRGAASLQVGQIGNTYRSGPWDGFGNCVQANMYITLGFEAFYRLQSIIVGGKVSEN